MCRPKGQPLANKRHEIVLSKALDSQRIHGCHVQHVQLIQQPLTGITPLCHQHSELQKHDVFAFAHTPGAAAFTA